MAKRSSESFRQLHVSPYRLALLMGLGIFLVAFSISSYFAKSTLDQNQKDHEAKMAQKMSAIKSYTTTSMEGYSRLLLSASALLSVKEQITASEWEKFYTAVQVENNFPSMLGIGYIAYRPSEEAAEYQEAVRSQDVSNFTIYPQSTASHVAPVVYLAPSIGDNAKVVGYDMFTDPKRRVTMERARDEAKIVMTAPVRLIQDSDKKDATKGVLIYYPVYRSGNIPSTLEARRNDLTGYVYVVMRPNDMVSRYVASHQSDYTGTSIKMQDKENATTLYEVKGPSLDTASKIDDSLTIDTREWTMALTSSNAYTNKISPIVLFILGGIVSLLIAGTVYWALIGRLRRLTNAYEGEVQRTKDELLALASHQLRTPASGVKQYIGILTSGIVGELSKEQQVVADKAYEANERQIQIINELLYVSKADAGQLVIEPKEINVTKLVQKAVDDFSDQAAQKNITISYACKRPHIVVADDRFISMVIENLVSNAVKYSYPSSQVKVTITSRRHSVRVNVKDKGVGVDPNDYEQIFGKFNRIDNPLSHVEGGSGLGLFLARQLARAHGGDITIDSRLEEGSVFTLSLPKKFTINETIVHLNPTNGKERI